MNMTKVLDEKFVVKARKELREDDNRKKQALEHFREWIRKHPFIKEIRQGEKSSFVHVNRILTEFFAFSP